MARSSGLCRIECRIPGTSVIALWVPRCQAVARRASAKHGPVEGLRSRQYVSVIKISRAGIEHTAPQDGLHLFRQNGSPRYRPTARNSFLRQRSRQSSRVSHGGDGVAGGHINAQRNGQRFKTSLSKPPCIRHRHRPPGSVRSPPHLKVDRVRGRHCTDLLQRAADGVRRQRKIFSVVSQVHRRPVIQSYP